MNQLFIEIEIQNAADETEIYTSINSFIALYIYKYLRSPDNIKLNFVCTTLPCIQAKLKLNSEKLRRELTEQKIICKSNSTLQAIRDLKMPVFAKEDNTYISGMCAVCREIVVRQGNVTQRKLLGFKGSCLLAPAETSIWTRFCEVNIVESLNRILTTDDFDDLPQEVPRFEGHMNEPVRMHNIYKLARDNANAVTQNNDAMGNKKSKVVIDCKTPKEHLPIEHRFAEGIAFTIADLILYPCFRIIFERCLGVLEQFPLVNTWLCEIDAFDPFCQRTYQQLYTFPATMRKSYLFNIPDVERSSLYKSDPKRYKPRNRIFTEQSVVDASLAKLQKLQLKFNSDSDIAYSKMTIDWNEIEPEHERNSALPMERLERKRHQLENLANVVGLQANTGDRIVDFCSGTGHLGILLALQLPQCTVIFLENKPISLERAKKRALELKLENCQFYQCNIDYFEGQFNIGTSLHACGTATDIVLQQCMRSRAKFVCCPCCYGSLQPMPHISYPRSERFRSVLQEKDLLHIAHTADQAHELGTKNCRPETTRQGQLCMDIIDTDRKLLAEEAGYEVVLTRLKPENCTPKNRLLIGSIVNER